jgi:hypothetical protein
MQTIQVEMAIQFEEVTWNFLLKRMCACKYNDKYQYID